MHGNSQIHLAQLWSIRYDDIEIKREKPRCFVMDYLSEPPVVFSLRILVILNDGLDLSNFSGNPLFF